LPQSGQSVEVLDAHLAVIARVIPDLNAIVTLGRRRGRACWQNRPKPPYAGRQARRTAGLPVAIKEITPTAGIRTTYARRYLPITCRPEDAEAVRRLKAAGAIVLGKTNTPGVCRRRQHLQRLFGVTRNPWNPH